MTAPPSDAAASAATRRSYDAVAERYATEIGDELDGKPLDRALLDAFVELAPGGPIVDVGCGPGHATAHLARHGARTLGVDLSPAMCAVARRATALPFAAADMTALPIRSHAAGGILCWYAVIHLDQDERAAAYTEFARVLRPGGHALIAFHTSDTDTRSGQARHLTEWWDRPVDLTFRFLDPAAETAALARAGLTLAARLDRAPHPGLEHASRRSYLLVRRLP
ncbi:class I SAM-dependent methyltransferase [Streptomyces sp. XD-27]|uniref:class I SAM-dependent methyltransferase n=1 Tax=Streptomyces sp. XD-27 TaxID=3062779 RepID=UPI0026F47399|nr:class I SAM-dependent methyltransferase [Streptomyces sp. XD-27]WKX72149.1 class I SAM-dependent methyltransferase [Streptomyces sp. XD-27]